MRSAFRKLNLHASDPRPLYGLSVYQASWNRTKHMTSWKRFYMWDLREIAQVCRIFLEVSSGKRLLKITSPVAPSAAIRRRSSAGTSSAWAASGWLLHRPPESPRDACHPAPGRRPRAQALDTVDRDRRAVFGRKHVNRHPVSGIQGPFGPQTGEIFRPEEFRRTDHPVCVASEASRLFINAAATPPFQGGECVRTETVCQFIHTF